MAKQKTKQTVPNDDPVVPGMDKLASSANKTEVVLVSGSKDWSNKNSPLEKKERLIRPRTLPPNRSKTTCLNLIKLAGLSCKQNQKRQILQPTAPILKNTICRLLAWPQTKKNTVATGHSKKTTVGLRNN